MLTITIAGRRGDGTQLMGYYDEENDVFHFQMEGVQRTYAKLTHVLDDWEMFEHQRHPRATPAPMTR